MINFRELFGMAPKEVREAAKTPRQETGQPQTAGQKEVVEAWSQKGSQDARDPAAHAADKTVLNQLEANQPPQVPPKEGPNQEKAV